MRVSFRIQRDNLPKRNKKVALTKHTWQNSIAIPVGISSDWAKKDYWVNDSGAIKHYYWPNGSRIAMARQAWAKPMCEFEIEMNTAELLELVIQIRDEVNNEIQK